MNHALSSQRLRMAVVLTAKEPSRQSEPDLFAFHIRTVNAQLLHKRIATVLRPVHPPRNTMKSIIIVAYKAHPCPVFPAKRPNVYVREKGIRRIRSISRKLVNGVGFSKRMR